MVIKGKKFKSKFFKYIIYFKTPKWCLYINIKNLIKYNSKKKTLISRHNSTFPVF